VSNQHLQNEDWSVDHVAFHNAGGEFCDINLILDLLILISVEINERWQIFQFFAGG
jgi:hypothetical protein